MKNKPYDLYELPLVHDLKDMLLQKKQSVPNKVAFIYAEGKGTILKTYQDFYEDVIALGTWIFNQDLKEKHIAIFSENSYEWLICFFAVVCGGNVAVPIDKELSDKEVSELLQMADVQAIFYSEICSGVTEKLWKDGMQSVSFKYSMTSINDYIQEGKRILKSDQHSFVNYLIDSKKLCCIMYTSGTSGKSKGVMLSHENIAEDINGSCQLFALEGNTISVLPFHHAFGLVVSIFMAFQYGYSIYINKSLKRIQSDLQYVKPQTMFLVPLFVENFYKQIWQVARKEKKEKLLRNMMRLSDFLLIFGIDLRKRMFKTIRSMFGGKIEYIICGGAYLDSRYVKEFRSWGIEILNGYGTTECAPCVAVNRNDYHKDGTVGIAVPQVEIKISSDEEIWIKGTTVMMGYYCDLESTDMVFNEKWYKTGDLGYVDADGFLTLIGRKKNLIILGNGENVSPEELEAKFLKYEEVQEVMVYAQDNMIIAEIYPNKEYLDEHIQIRDFRSHFDKICQEINRNCPRYKQIGSVLLRDVEFPKNTSRKIVRYK